MVTPISRWTILRFFSSFSHSQENQPASEGTLRSFLLSKNDFFDPRTCLIFRRISARKAHGCWGVPKVLGRTQMTRNIARVFWDCPSKSPRGVGKEALRRPRRRSCPCLAGRPQASSRVRGEGEVWEKERSPGGRGGLPRKPKNKEEKQ